MQCFGNKNISWFQVTMNHTVMVCVLHAVTKASKELEPLRDGQAIMVAKSRYWQTVHPLHRHIGVPGTRRACVVNRGDIDMVKFGKRSLLCRKPPKAVRSNLVCPLNLESYRSLKWFDLFCKVDDSHPALADLILDHIVFDDGPDGAPGVQLRLLINEVSESVKPCPVAFISQQQFREPST